MGQVRRDHGANERDVIDLPGQMRHHLGDPHATLAVPGKLVRTAHDGAGILEILNLSRDLLVVLLAVLLFEHGLWIE